MIFDSALLHGPIYNVLAVPAVLQLAVSNAEYSLAVIDKTDGVELPMAGDVAVATIKPACKVRMSELTAHGIALDVLRGSTMTFNGKTWRIESKIIRSSVDGEANGEIMLILIEND
jgi:hypothetical protein